MSSANLYARSGISTARTEGFRRCPRLQNRYFQRYCFCVVSKDVRHVWSHPAVVVIVVFVFVVVVDSTRPILEPLPKMHGQQRGLDAGTAPLLCSQGIRGR